MAKIVVGVDGSEHGAAALRWAAREAELRGGGLGALTAVLVWDLFNQRHADGTQRFDPDYDETQADAALLATLEATLGTEAAAPVVRKAVCDIAAQGLIEASKDADLLVVGARGLGGFRGLLLGSVSQQVLYHAHAPVAIVRSAGESPYDPDATPGGTARSERIVVGVDGSPSSRAATSWAVTEAQLRGATVQAVHAWEVPMIYGPIGATFPFDTADIELAARKVVDQVVDEAIAAAGGDGVAVERIVMPGGAAASILGTAENADLVVIGRRGLGGFKRLMLGSVSENIARHAPCPVVVMPPMADGAGGGGGGAANGPAT
jgi:nucleotide-binding universal stress UspA family protein